MNTENGIGFLNKRCKLILGSGFVIYGVPREITSSYVIFETTQKTSMIGFSNIRSLELDPKFYIEGE